MILRKSLKIGIGSTIFNGEENNYSEGLQWWIPKKKEKII
jgi:hypothetical protein